MSETRYCSFYKTKTSLKKLYKNNFNFLREQDKFIRKFFIPLKYNINKNFLMLIKLS